MSTDGEFERPSLKRKYHRACDYCREHRIRCVYEVPDVCKHCVDYNILCQKVAPAPKDTRSRKRLMFKLAPAGDGHQGLEPGYLGGSSLSQLVWLFCPAHVKRKLHAIDVEHDLHRGAICDADEQGLLVGRQPARARRARATSFFNVAHARLAESVGGETVLSSLYGTASEKLITVFPVISKHESLLTDEPDERYWELFAELHHNSTPPTPLPGVVRIIHCALAAMSRDVPNDIRNSVLFTLRGLLLGEEFEELCRISTISSIQVLVLLTMCDDLNGGSASSPWLKLGLAIRMAQELALHRIVSLDLVPFAQRNRRSRVWGACICADRWMALRQGQTLAIDLDMCDVPILHEYPDHARDSSSGRWSPSFRFLSEFTKLSVLLGRVYRLTHSPSGLLRADDASLLVLQTEIDIWLAQLPTSWPYSPHFDTPEAAELINIFYVAVEFIFLRPFLWPAAPLPPHLIYRPAPQRWSAIVNRAQQATRWAESAAGTFYIDVWSNVMYPLVCCLFIHLKLYEQNQSADAKAYLERADDVVQSWASHHPDEPQRQKIAAMTNLLRRASGPTSPSNTLEMLTPGGTLSENWFQAVVGADCDFGLV